MPVVLNWNNTEMCKGKCGSLKESHVSERPLLTVWFTFTRIFVRVLRCKWLIIILYILLCSFPSISRLLPCQCIYCHVKSLLQMVHPIVLLHHDQSYNGHLNYFQVVLFFGTIKTASVNTFVCIFLHTGVKFFIKVEC